MGYVTFQETGSIHSLERADVIGWLHSGVSMLVECKRTRADFKRDGAKICRQFADMGFGVNRYFLCPAGLLSPDEMPPQWGLLWAYEARVVVKKQAQPFDAATAAHAEKKILTALLYRLNEDVRLAYAELKRDLPSRYQ